MADLISMLAASGAAEGEATDAEFQNTVLLLHGDGTNGAQNNTFLDSSTNNFTITRNGNTTQGTFSPFSKPDGRWGNYFDGSGDKLNTASNAAFGFGTGNFTVELWIYPVSVASKSVYHGSATDSFIINVDASNKVVVRQYGVADLFTTTNALTLNAWNHVAVSRSSTTLSVWINGTREATGSNSTNWATTAVYIGGADSSGSDMTGYLSNVRAVKGTAVYDPSSTTITVPTTPLTAITNTSLLTCQSNRFIDNSSNAFAITRNGDVKVTPFSPFPITTAYDPAVNGGAGYFDGSGDYLSVSGASLTPSGVDVTIDFWFYPTATGTNLIVFQSGTGSSGDMQCLYDSGLGIRFQAAGVSGSLNNNIKVNSWNYIVCVKSGTNFTAYVNGVAGNTVSITPNNTTTMTIGGSSTSDYITGYISGFRFTTGAANVPSGIPTAPPTTTVSSGTCAALLNFTNAGILDNTGFNALETVGNAQIDTSTVKYGTGSMEFDGTGDYVVAAANTSLALGTGEFTVEMWLYPTAFATYISVWCCTNSATVATGFHIGFNASGQMFIYQNSAFRISSSANSGVLTLNQWNHVAVVRSSGVVKIYVDGTAASSTWSTTQDFSQGFNLIGAAPNGGSEYYTGYIDDLRITKGIARYTTTFTPPTAAFPDIGD
jgi:hypothetical protein